MSMREYGVVEAQNLAMGQAGSIFVNGTDPVTCGAGSGSGGLVAETEQLFPDDTGTGTLIDADGGAAIDGETFPQGMTIYGRFTGFTLASGACIAYVG